MIRLIASDLDGTLLQNGAQTLNPEIFDIILALKTKGIHFAAASGRQLANLQRLFEPVKDELYYIAENGAVCLHDGELLCSEPISRELMLRLILDVRSTPNCSLMVSGPYQSYAEKADERLYRHVSSVLGYDIELVEDLTELDAPIIKMAVCNFDGITHSDAYFKERYSKDCNVMTSGNIWMDFMNPSTNKGAALQALTQHLGISLDDCMVFGDQYNDLEMLQLAGASYAMKNAAPGISDHADFVTESVEATLLSYLRQLG